MKDQEPSTNTRVCCRIDTDSSFGLRLSIFQWVACFLFIEIVWTFVGGAVTMLFFELTRNRAYSSASWLIYLGQHMNFLVLFSVIWLCTRYVLRVPLGRFVTDAPRFRWSLFRYGAIVWLVGIAIGTVVTALLEPEAIMINRTDFIWDRLTLMAIALIFTPLQCIAEELLFRTLLWRMFSGRVRKGWVIAGVSGVVFTIAHLANAEVQTADVVYPVLFYYFLTGALFMEINRRHGGSEAVFGAHVANNIFLVMVINYTGSSLASDPWFIQQSPVLWLDLTILILCCLIILYGTKSVTGEQSRGLPLQGLSHNTR